MCDVAHVILFDRFDADLRAHAAAEGGVLRDDYRLMFDEWLDSPFDDDATGRPLSREEAELRKALGVAA